MLQSDNQIVEKIVRAVERHNRRDKQIKFYACYCSERYIVKGFLDYDHSVLLPIHSITKAITCATVIQLAQRYDIALNRPLLEHLPYAVSNDRAKHLTIEQFANMTTGIEWSEIDSYQKPNSSFEQFIQSARPLDYLFSRKIAKAADFNYNSAASHALAYWAEAVSGQFFEELVREMVFEPLAIERYHWQRDATGRVYGGHGLALMADDFIKLMPLLSSGCYGDKKVLTEAVLAQLHQCAVSRAWGSYGYGYGLWHGKIKNAPFIGAFGNAGQRIYYFPTLAQSHAFLGNTKPEIGIQEAILKSAL